MIFKETQGNSLWIKVICENYLDVDVTWTNFTGSWRISDSAGLLLSTGALINEPMYPGVLYARILAANTRSLNVNTGYSLAFEVRNALQEYEEESHHTLRITAAERIV